MKGRLSQTPTQGGCVTVSPEALSTSALIPLHPLGFAYRKEEEEEEGESEGDGLNPRSANYGPEATLPFSEDS